ncbi:SdrD B-like domain-containing protein, partial [Methylomagnum sp.]
MLLLFSMFGVLGAVQPVWAVTYTTVQAFYVPLPENKLLDMFTDINGADGSGDSPAPVSPVTSNTSIAPSTNGTVIVYDHWEDGYETDINNPVQSSTEIWGDNNAANGKPPGFANDLINAGNVFILTNDVVVTGTQNNRVITVTSPYQYNGGDKFAATKSVSVSRVDWSAGSSTNMTQSTLVYDTSFWGTQYRLPVGTNTANSYAMFDYTAVAVMAGKNGAKIQVDANGDNTYEITGITLAQGQTYWSPYTLVQGARVRSVVSDQDTSPGNPIQVNFLTGDINSGGGYYESRDGALLPTDKWSSDYYTPVSTDQNNAQYVTKVFLFNPTGSSLTINWEKRIGTAAKTTGTIAVGANSSSVYTVDEGAAMRFYGGTAFYAFSASNAGGTTTTTTGNTQNSTYDWGYPLVPANALTPQLLVSYGVGGVTGTVAQSNCPVWITPVGNGETAVTVYVDFNGDGTSDTTYSLKELQQQWIYDSSGSSGGTSGDGDQTGMAIWVTTPGVKLAGAWGEHTSAKSNLATEIATPGLDAGTGIPPLPSLDGGKSSSLAVDADGNGFISPGDTIEYSILINNISHVAASGIVVVDNLPADTTYVASSTRYRISSNSGTSFGSYINIPDGAGGTLPLAGSGYTVADTVVALTGQLQVTFRVTIDSLANLDPGRKKIDNCVNTTASGISYPFCTETPVLDAIDHYYQTLINVAVSGNASSGDVYLTNSIFSKATNPTNGTVSNFNAATGTYTYTPNNNYTGTDSFTYTLCLPAPRDTTCDTATEYITIVSSATTRTLSGTVFNDLDLSQVKNGAETFTNAGNTLWVTAVNVTNGTIVGTAQVAIGGTWSLTVPQNTTYNLVLAAAPSSSIATLPSGWMRTGENKNGTVDGNPNGVINQAVVTSNVSNLNFGIVQPPDVSVTKTNGVNGVASGGTTTYTIVVTNSGPIAANNTVITDSAVAGLTKTGTPSCAAAGGAVCPSFTNAALEGSGVTVATFPAGGSLTITLTANVTAVSGAVTNTVTAALPSQFTDPTPTNNTASDTDPVFLPASLGDRVWNDLDGDGVQDGGETNLANVRVYVDSDNDNSYDVGEPTATTDANGLYSITGLAAGTYNVRVDITTLPAGYSQTYDLNGGLDHEASVILTAGQARTDIDCGYQQQNASIGDFVWNDLDGDGVQDGGSEVGIGSVKVYVDSNGNSSYDSGEPTATTNGGGAYTIGGLAAGAYSVRIDTSTLPAGYVTTYDVDGKATANVASVTLTAGQTRTDVDFGYQQQNASIGDRVWNDADGDGGQDGGEAGLTGVTVFLDTDNDGVLDGGESSTTTGANGAYSFTGLAAGSYHVRVLGSSLPAGYVQTFDLDGTGTANLASFSLTAGEAKTDVDFGYRKPPVGSIGNRVWLDENGDGVQDPGEAGIPNLKVELYDAAGATLIATTWTDTEGGYLFADVPAGVAYRVVVTPTAGLNPTYDEDGTA